jgi:hypothetical protein
MTLLMPSANSQRTTCWLANLHGAGLWSWDSSLGSAKLDRARVLRQEFAALVEQPTGNAALDERIAKTETNGELLVVEHPNIQLHNNDMEPQHDSGAQT